MHKVGFIGISLLFSLFSSNINDNTAKKSEVKYISFTNDTNDAILQSNFGYNSAIGLEQIIDIYRGDNSVKVGVIDTGIYLHDKLTPNILFNECFDATNEDSSLSPSVSHGTMVAGIIGAKENSNGMIGVCENVKIVSLKAMLNNYSNPEENDTQFIADCLEYAENHDIKIVNLSLQDYDTNHIIYNAISNFDGLVICGAGNDGINFNVINRFDYLDLDNVITVGALNGTNDDKAGFSNFGNKVHLFAPGSSITSTSGVGNSYGVGSGTSFSAPFVTGLAALLLSYNHDLTTSEIKNIILNSVTVNPSFGTYCSTSGIINIMKAFQSVHNHVFNEIEYINGTKHKIICECGFEREELHNTDQHTCIMCNGYSEIHTYGEPYISYSNTQHYATCSCNDVKLMPHVIDASSTGFIKYCSLCGARVTTGIVHYDLKNMKVDENGVKYILIDGIKYVFN